MNALACLYAGNLSPYAFHKVFPGGKSAFNLAVERVRLFPGWQKTVILGREGDGLGLPAEELPADTGVVLLARWSRQAMLETVSRLSQGFDLSYIAWADVPFLDPELGAALAGRHLRYAAEYSYADGWPYGFAPELLSPGTAGVLAKIAGGGGQSREDPVERDSLFAVLQKDINSFDIETELSPVDLRSHRLSLCADSKRNLLLLTRFSAASASGIPGAAEAAGIIEARPEILRTLPVFYPIQAARPCPQSCAFCPYPAIRGPAVQGDSGAGGDSSRGPASGPAAAGAESFLDPARFGALLDRIAAFSGDAVIDLSLWGELALHPRRLDLIRLVLERPQLALVIETSGLGWNDRDLEEAAALAAGAADSSSPGLSGSLGRCNGLPPLSWILSLDTADPLRYREIRGPGFAEAVACAKKLLTLFPDNAYVQAVRTAGAEDDIERFYRSWKEIAPRGNTNIIIQKYDDFCGSLPNRQAADLSPIERQSCWHLMRDLPVLLDGTVPLCREELPVLKGTGGRILGNVYQDSLETIWSQGETYYVEHCKAAGHIGETASEKTLYPGVCAGCDEYYTYNF